jgi:hypothetical protein
MDSFCSNVRLGRDHIPWDGRGCARIAHRLREQIQRPERLQDLHAGEAKGRYLWSCGTSTVGGAPLFFTKKTNSFAGSVVLAFRLTM